MRDDLKFKGDAFYANAIILFISVMGCFGLPKSALFEEGESLKEGNIRLVQEFIDICRRSPYTK